MKTTILRLNANADSEHKIEKSKLKKFLVFLLSLGILLCIFFFFAQPKSIPVLRFNVKAVSPDLSCGPSQGFTCPAQMCCSPYGKRK